VSGAGRRFYFASRTLHPFGQKARGIIFYHFKVKFTFIAIAKKIITINMATNHACLMPIVYKWRS